MSALQQESTIGAQLAADPAQSRSKRQPPLTQRAAFAPSMPAGSQIALAPGQSAALLQASLAQTLVGMTVGPPQLGCAGPATHLLPPMPLQSDVRQQVPGGTEHAVASGTGEMQTR